MVFVDWFSDNTTKGPARRVFDVFFGTTGRDLDGDRRASRRLPAYFWPRAVAESSLKPRSQFKKGARSARVRPVFRHYRTGPGRRPAGFPTAVECRRASRKTAETIARETDRAPDGSLTDLETGRQGDQKFMNINYKAPQRRPEHNQAPTGNRKRTFNCDPDSRRTLGFMTQAGVYAEDMPNGRRFKCDISIREVESARCVPVPIAAISKKIAPDGTHLRRRPEMTLPADMSPYVIVLVTFLTELVLSRVFSPAVLRHFRSYRAARPSTQQKLHLYPASILVTLVENTLSLYILLFRSDVSPHRYDFRDVIPETRDCSKGSYVSDNLCRPPSHDPLLQSRVSGITSRKLQPNLIVRQLGGIWLGRILAELVLTLEQQVFGVDILVHHLVSLITGSQAVFVGAMPWHMNLGIMMELSNPFQTIRIVLLELGQKTSQAYVINGLCFVTVFFLCRIATIPLYWYYTLPVILSGRMFQFDWLTIVGALGTHTVFELMSVYWFGKMVRSVLKLVRGEKRKES
ncbi:hypothetical protein Bbelb_085400 [Branchiostoma belcheri]|nr:hypothetical protein Bbelb_085400 [Branchiostoma belcheri]